MKCDHLLGAEPNLRHSGAPPLGGEPGIHKPQPVVMDSGLAASRRPGMMEWTAPDGIISAKLVVLIRSSKGDRP